MEAPEMEPPFLLIMLPYLNLSPAQYGDVGRSLSPQTLDQISFLHAEYDKASRYYSGEIFQERVEVEANENDAPLLYPVGVNLVKLMTMALTDGFLGEHQDVDPILFVSRNNQESKPYVAPTVEYLSRLLRASSASSMFWEFEFSRNLYGGSVLRVVPDLATGTHVRWARVPVDSFYPIFHPEDPNVLLEAIVITHLTQEQARALYGITSTKAFVVKVERWTASEYETSIDGTVVSPYSGVNPWGVVPFVYIPRLRTINWFGEGMAKDLYSVQDELNMRLADVGDTLNYNSHPVYWGINLPQTFTSTNYPVAPNAFWDLGRSFGTGGNEPKVGMLQSSSPVPDAAFKHIDFIYNWARTSSFAPPIAFGDDNGGGQRSGVTLELRLWPMLKSIRRSRSYMTDGIHRAMKITAMILKQKNFKDVDRQVIDGLLMDDITPQFHHILPKDQPAVVDEVVKLLSTNPPSISLETAQEALGRGVGEVQRIITMMSEHPDWFEKALQTQTSETPQPGETPA
jgi:hypothetical protein